MTRQEIQRLVKHIGLRPQQAAGQHFLMDEAVCQEMVKTAEVGPNDAVLEIGPGLGVLTEHLLAAGARVIGVELDRRLAAYLTKHYQDQSKLRLVHQDVFKVNLNEFVTDREYKLVANLPYSATSLVFRNFLTLLPRPSRLTVMLQTEVAERIVAQPGKMSLLAVSVQYYATPRLIAKVPKTSFWPAPAVTSAVLDCRLKPDPDPAETKPLFRLARMAFAGKRKQLHNSLGGGLGLSAGEIGRRLQFAGVDGRLRPQDLSLEDWRRLAKKLL